MCCLIGAPRLHEIVKRSLTGNDDEIEIIDLDYEDYH